MTFFLLILWTSTFQIAICTRSTDANDSLTLVSAFNEFERSIVKERQREGIELAKKRGAFKLGVCRISDEKVSHMKHLAVL